MNKRVFSIGEMWRSGMPEEIKEKIRLTKRELWEKGKLKMPNRKGLDPWNKGKSLSSEHREKIAMTKRQQYERGELRLPDNTGRKSWNSGRKWTLEEKNKFRAGAKKMWERRRQKKEIGVL